MNAVLRMDEKDNLLTCLRSLRQGEKIEVDGAWLTVLEDIPQFHKIAAEDIPLGGACRKYGQVIGVASAPIRKGSHAHVQNIESTRGRGDRTERGQA